MDGWSTASEGELPLDVSEFKCIAAGPAGVVVVFGQTNRRYTYSWNSGELGLAAPAIEGECGLHDPEIIDCLARAVAYRAARELGEAGTAGAAPIKSLTMQLRDFLFQRG